MRFILLASLVALLLVACTESSTPIQAEATGKKVEEIKAGSNISDIVRMPVTESEEIDTVNVAKIVFEDKRHNFGTVNEGDIVRREYKFVNEGKAPLIITKAKSTCGCTIPEWPKEPLNPGEGGVISVRFDTKNKTERQVKPITIIANTYPKETYLQLAGFVTPKE